MKDPARGIFRDLLLGNRCQPYCHCVISAKESKILFGGLVYSQKQPWKLKRQLSVGTVSERYLSRRISHTAEAKLNQSSQPKPSTLSVRVVPRFRAIQRRMVTDRPASPVPIAAPSNSCQSSFQLDGSDCFMIWVSWTSAGHLKKE